METREHYQLLATVFQYPDCTYKEAVRKAGSYIQKYYPSVMPNFMPFLNWVEENSEIIVEEVFAKTFHIQAICFLDLGYVLFAEDYKRGEFLVQMKRELAEAKINAGNELADNLPNVLKWLSVVEDEIFLEEFSTRILKVALLKMLDEFDLARIELKDKVRRKKQKVILLEELPNKNIFQYVIQALYDIVCIDFPENKFKDPKITPTIGGDFLKNCNSGSCSTHQPTLNKV